MRNVVQFVPKDAGPLSQSGSDFISDNGEIHASFTKDATTGANMVVFKNIALGTSVNWYPQQIKYVDDNGIEDVIVDADYTSDLFVTRGYHARYDRHFPDVDEFWRVEAGKIKHFITLTGEQRDPLPFLTNPKLAVSGVLEFDASYKVRSMGMVLNGDFTSDQDIFIIDENGREVFQLPSVTVWDQAGNKTGGYYVVNALNPGRLQFSLCVDQSWLAQDSIVYPVIIDPTVVVSSAYNVSGNGGRKIVRLSNGWIVSSASNTSSNWSYWYVSKDNGQTWAQLCYAGTAWNYFALCSIGTCVYTLAVNTSNGAQTWFYSFDASTVTNAMISQLNGPETGQTAMGSCSIASDGTGALHAFWQSKNATYGNGFNIRYCKGTTNGATVTWGSIVQVTNYNITNSYYENVCAFVDVNNVPYVVFDGYDGTSTHTIGIISTNNVGGDYNIATTGWHGKVIFSNGNNATLNPCSAIDHNGVIHVVFHAITANTGGCYDVFYTKSSDGGSTWTVPTSIAHVNGYHQENATITITASNDIYVYFQGAPATLTGNYYQIRRIIYTNGVWGSITNITTSTSSNQTDPQSLWSMFNMNSDDAIRYMWCDGDGSVQYDYVSLNAAPNAPTLTPENNFDATKSATFAWTFSDPNTGDAQSAYQLQIVDISSNSTVVDTGKVASSTSSYTLAANTLTNGKQYQWRVQTWDSSGTQGPYSTYSTFNTAAAPSVSVTSPTNGQSVTSAQLTVNWSYSDPASNAQQSFDVQLLDNTGANVLWDSGTQNDPQNSVRSYTLGYTLANNTSYEVRVTSTNSQGISATSAAVSLSVAFTPPAQATTTVTPNANGYQEIDIVNPAPTGSEPDVSSNDVYRRLSAVNGGSAGSWNRIATGIVKNGSFRDYAAGSGVHYDYKITSYGANGTQIDSTVVSATPLSLMGLWIHDVTDPSGTIMNVLYQTDNKAEQYTPTATVMQFAGRPKPAIDFGENYTYVLSGAKTTILTSDQQWTSLQNLLRNQNTLCFRDGRSRIVFGVAAGGYQETDLVYGVEVDLEITENAYSPYV